MNRKPYAVAGLLVPISLRNGWGFEPWPIFIALLLLALPPIFLNTYTAIRQVSPSVVEAARAMGYGERDVLFRVELALGTSVIIDGVRFDTFGCVGVYASTDIEITCDPGTSSMYLQNEVETIVVGGGAFDPGDLFVHECIYSWSEPAPTVDVDALSGTLDGLFADLDRLNERIEEKARGGG